MSGPLRILLIDDNPDDRVLVIRELRREFPDLQVEQIIEAEGFAQALEAGDFDLVITDYQLRWTDGLAVLRASKARCPDCPVIMFTATGNEEIAVEAMKNGLDDYILKSPKHFIRLPAAVRSALKRAEDSIERVRAEEALQEYSERLEEMVEERTQELRDAQEELVRKEKLATLGQLAAGMSHELRNPLGVISNAAYYLNMVLEDPDPEVKEMLEFLEKEVRTCERIINSLLDFARTRSPIRREVDVNAVVQEALSRATVPENVEVVCQLDETLPTIQADPDQLGQVFGNIILNAVQAMTLPSRIGTPEGGRLVVQTSEVSGKLPKSVGEWVAASITDTGVGIPEENLEKLFEPLFTTKAKGIGLGLVVVKMLVGADGGIIEVESELGKGSAFTVRLPVDGE